MTIQETTRKETGISGAETAKTTFIEEHTPSSDILEPLLLLLAARRGIRTDPLFTNLTIPDDRAVMFAGPSGVEAINRSSLGTRILRFWGYRSKKCVTQPVYHNHLIQCI
ncbi:hypothetical protein N7462_002277 [Penicillium macrosclerotiorum]|uniref:uncharacterized protein n=1 Tax=Penicillium macrosclerotiorum TaxID=303699 RepID=UPI002546FD11|nr:uncharacterized protein N7462_002277 [Penicillium macrosclerotiorum]KAJ5692854.1 hypothetical protein N7462_002277 [Penicillium macrosclerotiorum]